MVLYVVQPPLVHMAPTAGADAFSTTVATPTVASLTETTAASGATTTLNFVTTNLVNDATRPYFKIIANGVACNSAVGVGMLIVLAAVN